MTVATTTEVLNAVRGYVWIAIAVVVLWKLFPQLKEILEKRGLKIKMLGAELTVQAASDQLQDLVVSLQEQVAALRERLGDPADQAVEPERTETVKRPTLRTPAILWVDDEPENNTLLMKTVRDSLGVTVKTAVSTADAVERLASEREVDLVITDMGRKEDGRFKPEAGIILIRELRNAGIRTPVAVFASSKAVADHGDAALEAGALLATSSRSVLLSRLRVPPTTPFEARVARDLQSAGYDLAPTVLRGTVDFVIRHDTTRWGVEVKNWRDQPSSARIGRAIEDAKRAITVHGLAGVVVVYQADVEIPVDTSPQISFVPSSELPARLAKVIGR